METSDLLLGEWDAIMRRIEHIDARLWQGAGILLVLSIGGFSVIGWSPPDSKWDVILVCAVGLFSMLLCLVWWFIFHRWLRIQRVCSHRAMEIEDKLDLRFVTYGRLFQSWSENTERIAVLKGKLKEKDPGAYDRLEARYNELKKKRFSGITIEHSLRLLTILVGLAWIMFVALYALRY